MNATLLITMISLIFEHQEMNVTYDSLEGEEIISLYINWTTRGGDEISKNIFHQDLIIQFDEDNSLKYVDKHEYLFYINTAASRYERRASIIYANFERTSAKAIIRDHILDDDYSIFHHLTLRSDRGIWKIKKIIFSRSEECPVNH